MRDLNRMQHDSKPAGPLKDCISHSVSSALPAPVSNSHMTQPNQSMVPNRNKRVKGAKLLAGITAVVLPCSAHAGNLYQTWLSNFDPNNGSSPSGRAVAVDKGGNVAVAGFTYVGGVQSFFTAKYDAFDGHQIWAKTFTAAGSSDARSVAFDGDGNVIATGRAALSGDYDYYTIKFRASDGLPLWQRPYDGPNGGGDEASFVAVDSADNVIVTGNSEGSGTDIFTRKYDSDGNVVSDFRYTSAGTRPDYPKGLAIDSAGKAAVCGVTTNANGDTDFYLAKYNLSQMAGAADWTKTFGTNKDDEAHGVAIDSANSVIVTGLLRNADNTHGFYTVKYDTDGVFKWQQTHDDVAGDAQGGARSVAVNRAGDVFVTGTTVVDDFNITFYTAKVFGDTGAIDWSARTPAPGVSGGDPGVNDQAVKVLIDGTGNPIVAGSAQRTTEGSDYYVVKYSADTGGVLSERRFNGVLNDDLTDTVFGAAVDSFGNVVVTGESKKAEGPNFQIITIKYGTTVLATDDPVVSQGIPEEARIATLYPPAVSTSGSVAARVTLAAGRKRLGAILTAGNGFGIEVPAYQGGPSGIPEAEFKSFTDPVTNPNGRIAFIGKVSGVKASESTGVWTNAFNPDGVLELALQQGKQVPGMAQGIVLQSVSSISLVNGQLLALIKVAGKEADVTKANSAVLYGLTDIGTGAALLRAGEQFIGGGDTTIKSLSVFVPAKGSPGQGRYHSALRSVARATLADKRTAIIGVNTTGTTKTVLAFTDGSASSITNTQEAKWKSFGLAAVSSNILFPYYAVAGSLSVGEGEVTKADDSVVAYSFNGTPLVTVAREGSASPGIGGATFASFLDPLIDSVGNVAFVGTAKGQGVSSKNKTGLWYGPAGNLSLVARLNHQDSKATDGAGAEIDATWSSFTSLALPGSSGPLFLAKISGKAASKKTSIGLWGVDSEGFVRKLIRNGDQLGDELMVKKFSVLQPVSGSVGASRSFSSGGTVSVLVDFSDKSSGVVNIGIP